ncbi:MAG: hypothetical protein ACYTHK_20595 [Planctomycetota bacterium]|jgi:hypothetical protein
MKRILLGLLVLSAASYAGTGDLDNAVREYARDATPPARPESLLREHLMGAQPLGTDKWTFGVSIDFWYPEISATVQGTTPGDTSIKLGSGSQIGLSGNEGTAVPAFYASKGRWVIIFGAFTVKWEDPFTLSQDVTLDGVTFASGTSIVSTFRREELSLLGGFAPLQTENFALTVYIGVEYWWYRLAIAASATQQLASSVENFAIPMLGILVDYQHKAFAAGLSVNGYYMDDGDRDANGWRADLALAWEFHPNWRLYGGYRFESTKVNGRDLNFDGDIGGFFAGIIITF